MELRVRHDVYHHFGPDSPSVAQLLAKLETRIVGVLSDKIAAASTSADGAIGRVQTDVTALRAQVALLQQQVDSGTASEADLAALDGLTAKLDALDPTSPVVLPTS
jgi:hypothetical protein